MANSLTTFLLFFFDFTMTKTLDPALLERLGQVLDATSKLNTTIGKVLMRGEMDKQQQDYLAKATADVISSLSLLTYAKDIPDSIYTDKFREESIMRILESLQHQTSQGSEPEKTMPCVVSLIHNKIASQRIKEHG